MAWDLLPVAAVDHHHHRCCCFGDDDDDDDVTVTVRVHSKRDAVVWRRRRMSLYLWFH